MKEKYFELRRKGFCASIALQVAKYTKHTKMSERRAYVLS